jgi:hypothetical protein
MPELECVEVRPNWRVFTLITLIFLLTWFLAGFVVAAWHDVAIQRELTKADSLDAEKIVSSNLLGWEKERTERKRYAWVQESLTVLVQERKWNRIKIDPRATPRRKP